MMNGSLEPGLSAFRDFRRTWPQLLLVTLATRDGEKTQVERDELPTVPEHLEAYDERIATAAQQFIDDHVATLDHLEERAGIIEVPWCGSEVCGRDMEDQTGMKSLGTPIPERDCEGSCAACGGTAIHWLRLAKSY